MLRAYEFKNQQTWQHTSLLCAVVEAHAGMGSKRSVSPRKYDMSRANKRDAGGSPSGIRLTDNRVEVAMNAMVPKNAPEYVFDPQTRRLTRKDPG